ncbi:MAG TPA: efflux RND transporter periplasmic adaptor subunit [Candidatus Rifleibacterium sp.]|nr:efflux RND transporter periplasmic adaptor subunit [Candidatus Rifleibacterium sp.]HPT46526.1 efflux RND transporter periplasmic adaptor subunit [Candidatus Rifleibacterium sp.]
MRSPLNPQAAEPLPALSAGFRLPAPTSQIFGKIARNILLVMLFCGLVEMGLPLFAQAQARIVPVRLLKPEIGTVQWTEQTTGELVAPQRAELKIKAKGFVGLVHVREGDRVKKGQPLAELDLEDANIALDHANASLKASETQVEAANDAIETAKIGREQAQIRLDTATLDFERAKSLRAKDTIPQQQYDQMEGQYKLARNAVAVADKQIKQAQTALEAARAMSAIAKVAVRSAKRRLEDSTLVAPYDGLIIAKSMIENEQSDNQSITIVDDSELELTLRLPERFLPFVLIGTKLLIRSPLVQESIAANVIAVVPSIDRKSLTFAARAVIANPDRKLSHGGYADVSVIIREDRQVPVLPVSIVKIAEALTGSLQSASRAGHVFTVRDGKALRTPVTVGISSNNRVAILSGLDADTLVVDRGFEQLEDGVSVKIENEADL